MNYHNLAKAGCFRQARGQGEAPYLSSRARRPEPTRCRRFLLCSGLHVSLVNSQSAASPPDPHVTSEAAPRWRLFRLHRSAMQPPLACILVGARLGSPPLRASQPHQYPPHLKVTALRQNGSDLTSCHPRKTMFESDDSLNRPVAYTTPGGHFIGRP
jgi:hypothetical protein